MNEPPGKAGIKVIAREASFTEIRTQILALVNASFVGGNQMPLSSHCFLEQSRSQELPLKSKSCWKYNQFVDCLSAMHGDLGSVPALQKNRCAGASL